MSQLILMPPVAFGAYVGLAALLALLGRYLAGPSAAPVSQKAASLKRSIYASGEASPGQQSPPGYTAYFKIALFFAVLHVSALILGTGGAAPATFIYLAGVGLALAALIVS